MVGSSGVAFKMVSVVKIENGTFPSKVGKSIFSVKQISGIFFREKAHFAAFMLSMHLFFCNGGSIWMGCGISFLLVYHEGLRSAKDYNQYNQTRTLTRPDYHDEV